jgi:hypothetical protein
MLTGVLLLLLEQLVDLVTDLALWNLDIILGVAVLLHEGKETIIGNVELSHSCQQLSCRHCILLM